MVYLSEEVLWVDRIDWIDWIDRIESSDPSRLVLAPISRSSVKQVEELAEGGVWSCLRCFFRSLQKYLIQITMDARTSKPQTTQPPTPILN